MLVLGRKVNEAVIIGDNVVVTLLAIEGDRVKLGIQAPPQVSILRHELYEMVKQENVRAANLSGSGGRRLASFKQMFNNRQPDSGRDEQGADRTDSKVEKE